MYKPNRSIASRFFITITLLIIANVFLFGITFVFFANRYFESDKLNVLNICVESVEQNVFNTNMVYLNRQDGISHIKDDIKLISETSQSIIILADSEGNIVTSTNQYAENFAGRPMPQAAIYAAKLTTVPVNVTDIFTANHSTKYYAVGKAVFDENMNVEGYIFACSSGKHITLFTNALLSMFLLASKQSSERRLNTSSPFSSIPPSTKL